MSKASTMIRVDKEVWAALKALAQPAFGESPNRVLRRLLGLDKSNE